MSAKENFLHKLSIAAVVLGLMAISAVWVAGQTTSDIKIKPESASQPTAYVDDWSHHHLIFSNPGTEADALAKGRYEEWLKITNDPRYQLQQLKRGTPTRPLAPAVTAAPQDFASRVAAATAPGDFSTRLGIALARPAPSPNPIGSPARRPTSLGQPIKKDWSVPLNGPGSAVATISGNNATSSSTVTINTTTLDASPPVAEVDTISVPSNTYCIAPGAGVTVGLNAKNVTTNGTAPTGGSVTVAGNGEAGATTIGGVVYTWEASVAAAGCGTTLNCVKMSASGGGTQGHANSAESLYRAINNLGASTCANTGATNPCYNLISTQGANAEATATYTANATIVNIGTWKCAGGNALYQITNTAGDTLAQPTGGGNGTAGTGVFAIPSTASAATLSGNINTAIGNDSVTGINKTYTSPTITLTASAAGSTGINTALDGSVTGVTIATATAGSDGVTNGAATPPTFAYWSGNALASDNTVASNIAMAIGQNTTLNGQVTAAANTDQVTVTAKADGVSYPVSVSGYSALTWSPTTIQGGAQATVQPNALPAKYGASLTTASCANDWVAYPTGMTGSASVASIVAYSNIYTSCSGTVPAESWAVNSGGAVTTSPILSLDGTQMAYIQVSGTAATLVLIKWVTGGTLTAPLSPTNQTSGANYHSCTPSANTPCMYKLAFANTNNDTISSPFYDAYDDIIYVGDDGGYLHQFTGVFNGSPAESGSPWPVPLTIGTKVSSPVYDANHGYIYVGDFGGYLYSVLASSGAVTKTVNLGDVIADGPLLDGSSSILVAFITTGNSTYGNGTNTVADFGICCGPPTTPSGWVTAGTGGAGYYFYAGSFDNVYYETTNHSTGGNLYVVGNTGATTGAALYQVAITGGVGNAYFGTSGAAPAAVSGLTFSGTGATHPWPSPVSEFCNAGSSACGLNPQVAFTGNVTASSKTVTGPTGTFSNADIGSGITGGGIPTGDTIASITSSTTATLTTAATASHTGELITITGGNSTTSGTDYVFFSVNRGAVSGCTTTAGNGCVLSYNVSSPGAVAISGAGLNTITPATNGCWATGGIVIDNSDLTTGGASQMYFLNLNGIAAGGPTAGTYTSSGCTTTGSSTAIIDAVQTQQSNP